MPESRILIVEDDVSWQENLKETLESINCVAKVVSSYEEADALLDRRHFHLMLVDLRLREGSRELHGMALVKKVAALAEGTSTIIISGYADATIATEALKRYDAFYVIEKERIDPAQFIELVNAALVQADERYRVTFPSAIDYLRGGQDTHSWAAEVLQAVLGADRQLGLHDLNQLRELLNELLEGRYPLLHHRHESGAVTDVEGAVMRARCWSKALGEPIQVQFGRRELIEQWVGTANGSSEPLVQGGLLQIDRIRTAGDLGGAVFILADTPFEDFDQPVIVNGED